MMGILMNYFDPSVDDADVKAVGKRYGRELLMLRSPVMGPEKISKAAPGDDYAQRVMRKMDAIRIFSDDLDPEHMGAQAVAGYVADTTRGRLGLVRAEQLLVTHQHVSGRITLMKVLAIPFLVIGLIVIHYLRSQEIITAV